MEFENAHNTRNHITYRGALPASAGALARPAAPWRPLKNPRRSWPHCIRLVPKALSSREACYMRCRRNRGPTVNTYNMPVGKSSA